MSKKGKWLLGLSIALLAVVLIGLTSVGWGSGFMTAVYMVGDRIGGVKCMTDGQTFSGDVPGFSKIVDVSIPYQGGWHSWTSGSSPLPGLLGVSGVKSLAIANKANSGVFRLRKVKINFSNGKSWDATVSSEFLCAQQYFVINIPTSYQAFTISSLSWEIRSSAIQMNSEVSLYYSK